MSEVKREQLESFVDKAGQVVRVGDFILYGHALGRCAGLKWGRVLKIEQVDQLWSDGGWRISVQGIDTDWHDLEVQRGTQDDEADQSWGKPAVCKRGTLMFPSRIVLANAFIPARWREMLEGAT